MHQSNKEIWQGYQGQHDTKDINYLYEREMARVQIQKEVISDLMREKQFLSKRYGVNMTDLLRKISKLVLKLDFTAHVLM